MRVIIERGTPPSLQKQKLQFYVARDGRKIEDRIYVVDVERNWTIRKWYAVTLLTRRGPLSSH
jgi:hypothetical protein